MIAFACGGCGRVFEVDAVLAGRKARCDQCFHVTRVPAAVFDLKPETEPAAIPSLPPGRRRWIRSKRSTEAPQPVWGGVERDGWLMLSVGLAAAVLCLIVPLVSFVLQVLKVIIHELGHTATAWLFAGPSVPSFDLTYGGGVSYSLGRQPLLVVVAYAIFAYVLFQARRDRRALIFWAIAAAAYTVVMFTPLRGLVIVAMGHGSEMLFAGVFLFRAMSGRQILHPFERPLYAMVGFYLVLIGGRFAVRLMTDDAARTVYGNAKGGGHWMDFDRLATDLGWPLERVAGVYLLAYILTPAAAYLYHRFGVRFLSGRTAA